MSVGAKIRDFRKQRNLSLQELGQLVGISYSFLSAVERDAKKPSVKTLKQIADALNIPVSYLIPAASDNGVGKKLRLIREGRCLEYEELAQVCNISVAELQAFEEGTACPTMDQLEVLAQKLGVTVRYFLENVQNASSIGQRIKLGREARSMTIVSLAEQSGVSPGLLSQIEHDQVVPSLQTLDQVAQALGTSVCYFLLDQQDVTDLLASLSPDMIELLGDPRVQAVLRSIRDFNQGELRFVLNHIDFLRKSFGLLKQA